MTDEQNGRGPGDREDPRPKPKYGELAPPGWTWQPPPDPYAEPEKPAEAEGDRPASAGWAPPPPDRQRQDRQGLDRQGQGGAAQPGPAQPGIPGQPGVRPRRNGDLVATLALLVFGLFSVVNNVVTLFDLDAFLRQFAALYDIEDYSPRGDFSAAGVGVGIFWIVLYLVTVWLSVLSLRARRITFWIPLVGGVIATISSTVLYLIALLSDPAVLTQLSTTPPL